MLAKPNSSSSQARILVVDDHPNTATTLARAISQLGPGIEVISATSGKIALERVKDGAVDLLITDMMMPDMNGLELIEKLQSHPAGRPAYTILITAYDVPGLKETARRLKVNETIIKPIRPERICQIVGRALEEMGHSQPIKQIAETRQPFNILVADDKPDNISLIARYLQSEGYAYITAADGVEALERTRAEMPDLILLDINMPRKDGFEVLQEVRSDPAIEHIPIIILTAARLDAADMQAGFSLGADDYVMKPFDRRELMARIRAKLRVKEAEDVIRRRNKELNVLPEIGKELSARIDINELTDIVLRRTVGTLGAMLGHIIILDPKGPVHKEYHISSGASVADAHLPPLNDLLSQIKESRQGLIIEDAQKDSRWQVQENDPTRSVIIVPMFGRLTMTGVLILTHEQSGYFTLEHQLLLQAIASQAAIAVENAQLYASVAQERQKLGAVLQSAADPILMFDADGCLSLLNPAAEKLFTDYKTQVGLPLTRGNGYDALINLLDETFSTKQSKSGEVVWPDRRAFAVLITPIEEGGGCVAMLHDVTHFKDLERVKNEFIATASHDLKNPLTVISGYSKLILGAGQLNADQLDFIQRIQHASVTMSELVQNMLDLAKMDAGVELKRERIDVGDLMFEMANEFTPQAQIKEQTLELKNVDGQVYVEGDPMQLRQALRNLIGNAIKYTPEKGSIQLTAENKDSTIAISVQDSGYGIPEADLPFIFDRFYRVRNSEAIKQEGNGLGLAIVKSIIDKHGGQIGVESEVKKGSRFMIALPLSLAQ